MFLVPTVIPKTLFCATDVKFPKKIIPYSFYAVLGTEKVPQRNFVTKILPNVRVNFLVRFASKPLFYWIMTSNPLELFRKFFGAVRETFWLGGSFLAPDSSLSHKHTCNLTFGKLIPDNYFDVTVI